MLPVNLRGSSSSAEGGNGDAHPTRVTLANEAEIFLHRDREREAGSFTLSTTWARVDWYNKIVGGCVHSHSAGRAGGDAQGHPQTPCLCLRYASQPRLLSGLGEG